VTHHSTRLLRRRGSTRWRVGSTAVVSRSRSKLQQRRRPPTPLRGPDRGGAAQRRARVHEDYLVHARSARKLPGAGDMDVTTLLQVVSRGVGLSLRCSACLSRTPPGRPPGSCWR
jgi:hypothetical protein